MPTVRLCPIYNGWQAFGNTGVPLNGGKVYTYAAGTSTPQATYTDSGGTVANANPIVLDSAGRPPAEVWLIEGDAYKFVVQDALANTLSTYDNIIGIHDFLAGSPTFSFAGTQFFTNVNISGNLTFGPTNAPRIKADFSNATITNRLIFQSSTVNGNTDLVTIPNGAATQSSFNVFNGTDTANAGFGHIAISNGEFSLQSSRTGGGTALPMTFYCGNSGAAETMRLNTSQQVLIGTTSAAITGAQLRVAGLVQLDNACAFSVHRNGVNFNVNNTTFTQIAFTTKDFDQNTSFSTGTSRFTPPSGKYLLQASAGQTGGVANQRLVMLLYKNGVAFKDYSTTTGGAAAFGVTGCVVVDANGTDYFEVYLYQDSGGATTMSGATVDTYFTGFRIG